MIPVLISLIVLAGLIVLAKKGALPSTSGPRLVLHYPASGPSPVALIALTEGSMILDRRLAELWQRRRSITDEVERALVATIEASGTAELRVGDTVGANFAAPRPQQLPLSVKVASPEYRAMVQALESRGVNDAPVVAEALLAATHRDAVPIFATVDRQLAGQLVKPAGGDDPYRSGPVAQTEAVTFEGRKLRIRLL